jgi:hypothetical protein
VNHARLLTSERGRRWVLASLPILALSAVLAACGGGSSTTAPPATTATTAPSSTSTPTSAARTAALTKYDQCLTSHGVPASAANGLFGGGRRRATTATTAPGQTAPTGTRPTIPAQYQTAFTACASLRPTGGAFFGGGGQFTGAQAAAYRNCLTIHGVTLPTTPTTTPGQPRPTGGFAGGGQGAQFANNPKFQAAQKACASLLPARTGAITTVPAGA